MKSRISQSWCTSLLLSLLFHPRNIFPWAAEWNKSHTMKRKQKSGAHCLINGKDRVISLSWKLHTFFFMPTLARMASRRIFDLATVTLTRTFDMVLSCTLLNHPSTCPRVVEIGRSLFSSGCFSWDVASYAMYKSNMKDGVWGFANSSTCECEACVEVGRASSNYLWLRKRQTRA